MSNRIAELVGILDKKSCLKDSLADPRIPPNFRTGSGSVGDSSDRRYEPQLSPVDLDLDLIHEKPRPDVDRVQPDSLPGWEPEEDTPFSHKFLSIFESDQRFAFGDFYHEPTNGQALVDSYAWYCPFHFYSLDYGIYVRKEGVEAVALQLARRIPRAERAEVCRRFSVNSAQNLLRRAAFFYFFLHEMFHHRVESFATRLEIVENQPRYVPYYEEVYEPERNPVLTDWLLEEGLAVGDVLRRISREHPYNNDNFWGKISRSCGVKNILRGFILDEINHRVLPAGYRMASQFLGPRDGFSDVRFNEERQRLSTWVAESSKSEMRNSEEWSFTSGMFSVMFDKNIIAYELISDGVASLPNKAASAAQYRARKALSVARKWKIKPIDAGGRTRGDHQWIENHRGTRTHIDTGRESLTKKDWEELLNLVNDGWDIELKPNEDGRMRFMDGPKAVGCEPRL